MGFQLQNAVLKLLPNLITFVILFSQGCDALKCYQCISLECSESQLFCEGVKEYILSQLPDLYYGYDSQRVPLCPSPSEDDSGWLDLQRETKHECEEEKADDATCVRGIFRVTTEIMETGKNVTAFGVALGCAKPALLKKTRDAAVKSGGCDFSSSMSRFKLALRHYLEIEHCARPPEMCHTTDFCIPPHAAAIKRWGEQKDEHYPFWTIVLGVSFILALAVLVLTLLGPMCNG